MLPKVLSTRRAAAIGAVLAAALLLTGAGCGDMLDEALGPTERPQVPQYDAVRDDPAAVIELFFHAHGASDPVTVCEIQSRSTDSASLLRFCVDQETRCTVAVSPEAAEQLAAVRVDREVVASVDLVEAGWVPRDAVEFPLGEPWAWQQSSIPETAVYLSYDDGWRVLASGWVIPRSSSQTDPGC